MKAEDYIDKAGAQWVMDKHPDERCKFRFSSLCAVPIECEHGYDVCPKCDPCTCASAEERGR